MNQKDKSKNKISPTVSEKSVEYQQLIDNVGMLLHDARQRVATAINTELVVTYWHIGRYIVEYEQKGNERAEYGSNLLNRLSEDLTERYGSGFGRSNVFYIRKLYMEYPKVQTLSELSWSHYIELLKIDDKQERAFYEQECAAEHWGIRELKRQKDSMLFQRLALSREKQDVMKLAREGNIIERPEDLLKDPYIFEFTGLPERQVYKENDLENALVNNLSMFLLELGKGFAFIKQQYRFSIAGRHYYVDLVFYNVILKCYCLIDLKRGEVQHEDIGQMNFYLNYFKEEVCADDDNPPVGIVLGAEADRITMKYATAGLENNVFISRYQLYLPKREQIEAELRHLLDKQNNEHDV